MNQGLDTLKFYRHKIDSLQKIVDNAEHTFLNVKWNEPPVQAATLIATTTIITVIVGFIFKDYLIPGWVEKRSKRLNGQQLFMFYKNNLFKAALSVNYRLSEIYNVRSHYLWKNVPTTIFYDYKYKSSIYRLCVLLGWIRAYQLQEATISIKNKDDEFHQISKCLKNLEATFADGQGVEMYATKKLCEVIQVNITTTAPDTLKKLSIEIDHLVSQSLKDTTHEYISELPKEKIAQFIENLNKTLDSLGVSRTIDAKNQAEVVRAVSIKLSLIYRDWQQGIGDLMIEKENDNLSVISFKKFEEIWEKPSTDPEKKWLVRMESIFSNLDMRDKKGSDSRIQQIEIIYNNIYSLLSTLFKIKIGPLPMPAADFKKLSSAIK